MNLFDRKFFSFAESSRGPNDRIDPNNKNNVPFDPGEVIDSNPLVRNVRPRLNNNGHNYQYLPEIAVPIQIIPPVHQQPVEEHFYWDRTKPPGHQLIRLSPQENRINNLYQGRPNQQNQQPIRHGFGNRNNGRGQK